jgi:serine/threonine-protein phosphatase 2A regulatory subunit B'
MLKSMKQKFGARRASTADKNEISSSAPQPRQQAATPSRDSQPIASNTGRQQATSSGREKPSQPRLDADNVAQYFAEPLPAFKDVGVAEKQALFVKKLHLCAFTFDFSDSTRSVREKEMKRQTLVELLDYVNTGTGKFTEAVSEDVIFMLSSNLFRALPPTKAHEQDNLDPEEEEPTLEPAWPHLQVNFRPDHATTLS